MRSQNAGSSWSSYWALLSRVGEVGDENAVEVENKDDRGGEVSSMIQSSPFSSLLLLLTSVCTVAMAGRSCSNPCPCPGPLPSPFPAADVAVAITSTPISVDNDSMDDSKGGTIRFNFPFPGVAVVVGGGSMAVMASAAVIAILRACADPGRGRWCDV